MLDRKRKAKPFGLEIKSGDVGGILARLYRQILHDLGITPERYEALMSRYVARAHLDPNRKAKAAARASLSKELLKAAQTFKTFIKGIVFLAVVRMDIRITLHHENGRVTDHGLSVILGELNVDESSDESSET